MKLTQKIPMPFADCGGTKFVVGRNDEAIQANSVLLLVKLGDNRFELRVVANSGDVTDPLMLAAFIDAAQVDAMEKQIAAMLANPKQPPKRKTKARATARTTTAARGER
jgi:hypothetical protein